MPSKQPVQQARGADIVVVNNNNDDPMISPPPPSSSSSTKSDADDEMNRQKAAVAADAINQLHPVPVGADNDNDESSITTRPPTAASRNFADAAVARRAAFDEATHIAQATHNSLRDAVGAFRVSTSTSRSIRGVVADDDETEAGGSAQTNLTSMATARSAQTSIYTNDNLPPNIDIIAEATLVESSERPGEYDEENPGAVCEHRSSSDQGGGNDPSDRSNGGDNNNNSSTDTKPAAAVVAAEPMDRFTIYLCGRHARFQIWHLVLIAAIAIALCVAIPVAVTSTNKSKEPPIQEQSFLWTEEELYKIVAPSISDSSTLFLESASGSGSGTPDNFNPTSDHTNHTPQEDAFQWLSDSLTSTSDNLLVGPTKQSLHWRIQQRYILAVLYYSTNGEEWKNQYGFLQTDIHECEWNGGKELNNGWKSMDCNDVGEITLMNLCEYTYYYLPMICRYACFIGWIFHSSGPTSYVSLTLDLSSILPHQKKHQQGKIIYKDQSHENLPVSRLRPLTF